MRPNAGDVLEHGIWNWNSRAGCSRHSSAEDNREAAAAAATALPWELGTVSTRGLVGKIRKLDGPGLFCFGGTRRKLADGRGGGCGREEFVLSCSRES